MRKRRLALEPLEGRQLLSTLTWDGNGGNGSNYVWSAWNNWNPAVVPQNGDTLVFAGTHKRSNWNDLSGRSIPQITIQSDGFNIDGNAITLGSGGLHFTGGTNGTISLPMSISFASTPVEVTGSRTLNLTDVISGAGGIAKSGTGTAVLGTANTFTGTTAISAGMLLVTGSLLNSNVVVNGGVLSGTGSVKSIDLNGGTVAPGNGVGTLTVTAGANLDNGTLNLQLNNGINADQLRVTAGNVTLGGNLALSAATTFAPSLHQVFALVNNAGSGTTSGSFAGYADGQAITLNGCPLEVRYDYDFNGDGRHNDVVLIKANGIPTAADDQYTVVEDHALVIAAPGVLGNDSDANGDALIASVVAPPAHGTLALNPDGSFTYAPNVNFNGVDKVVYQVADGKGGLAQATATFTVTPVADNPNGLHPDVLAWMLKNNPGLQANFLKTELPDKIVLLPDGRRVPIYQIDQFLDVNFRLTFSAWKKEGVELVETQELHLRKMMAHPKFYEWIRQFASRYNIAGKGWLSSLETYNYLRRIDRNLKVGAKPNIGAPVGGGGGMMAPSWAVWKQMNIFWHEAAHNIGIGHNTVGLSGPLAGKLRDWDRARLWNYRTININELEVPGKSMSGSLVGNQMDADVALLELEADGNDLLAAEDLAWLDGSLLNSSSANQGTSKKELAVDLLLQADALLLEP